MNIMNVTEHLFNPLVFWENEEKKERDTEEKISNSNSPPSLWPFSPLCQGSLSHDASANVVLVPQ